MNLVQVGQLLAALGAGSALPSLAKYLWRQASSTGQREFTRVEDLERLVEVLRRAIDKGRFREDALAQVLGVLIFGLRRVEDLSPAISDAIDRAIDILEGAQDRLMRMNNDGMPS